ncbi:MAG TPA: class I SAM-dependent methyltransferase [Burkholderiales bacterium]
MLLRVLADLFRGAKAAEQSENTHLARAHFANGAAKREAGRLTEALADFSRAAELKPDESRYLVQAAEVAFLAGQPQMALDYCGRLRTIAPELDVTDTLEACIRLGGEHYLQVMARILEALKPRTYVEIGVEHGTSLRLVQPPTLAIGIDPEPKLAGPLAANHKVFAETSDAFFASRDPRAELGGLPIDLAFIDGMHQFEFALRDFANLERFCSRDSTILLHDCYPLNRVTAERERRRTFWSGDIWRLIVLLKKYRPDLAINIIATPPTGLAVVRRLDPGSRFLLENHDRLCREFLALDYAFLEDDMAGKLNLFPNDWGKVRALLG